MKQIITVTFITIAIVFFAGCTVIEEPINLSSMPPQKAEPNNTNVNNKQQEASLRESVNAALVWSEKYEKLMSEFETLKKQNVKLTETNDSLQNTITVKQKELNQAQKELKEANDMLLSMRVELNNWKKDILGFREEMRQSQQAILAANVKILRELGAEVRTPMADEKVAKND